MYVKYDSYQHQNNEASITYTVHPIYSRWRGFRYAIRQVMTVQGELSCNHPSKTLSEQIEDLIDAYSVNGKTLGLYHDDGTPTRHILDSSQSNLVDGPKVIRRSWPDGNIAQYASVRSYFIEVAAEFAAPEGDDAWPGIVRYQETMRYIGEPGPRVRYMYDFLGNEYAQTVAAAVPIRMVQSGVGIGYGGYVTPIAAVLPTRVLKDLTDLQYESPTFGTNATKEYRSRWSFVMTIPPAAYGAYLPVSR